MSEIISFASGLTLPESVFYGSIILGLCVLNGR